MKKGAFSNFAIGAILLRYTNAVSAFLAEKLSSMSYVSRVTWSTVDLPCWELWYGSCVSVTSITFALFHTTSMQNSIDSIS